MTSSIVNGTSGSTTDWTACSATEAISASSSRALSSRAGVSAGVEARAPTISSISPSTAGAAASRKGRRHQVDPQGAVLGRRAPGQLDTAEPAFRQLADDIARLIVESDIGGSRTRADPGDAQTRADRQPPERRHKPHPPKAPGQETHAVQLGMPVGDQRQQRLQRAVQQRRMDDVRIERLVDHRAIEMRQRLVAASSSIRRTVRNRLP